MTDIPTESLVEEAKKQYGRQCLINFVHLKGEGRDLYNEVFCYVRRYIGGNFEDAEDIMTDVQLKAWLKRDMYDSVRELRPWIYTIATNTSTDHQRRNKRWNKRISLSINPSGDNTEYHEYIDYDIADEQQPSLDKLESDEHAQQLRAQISNLPEKYRQPIELFYFQGAKYRETANILQIPINTVKTRLRTGLMKLEKLLGKQAA